MKKELLEIFNEKHYISIKEKSIAQRFGIEVEYLYDNEKYPNELFDIYISENKNELFIILNCIDLQADISEICDDWDQKLLALSNFGMTDLYNLKYNMVQILICTEDNLDRIVEGSLNISRKIILKCQIDSNGNFLINDDEAVEIPFYMPRFKEMLKDEKLASELNAIIPDSSFDENSVFFKQYTRKNRAHNNLVFSMTDDVQKKFESWLEKYEDQKN